MEMRLSVRNSRRADISSRGFLFFVVMKTHAMTDESGASVSRSVCRQQVNQSVSRESRIEWVSQLISESVNGPCVS